MIKQAGTQQSTNDGGGKGDGKAMGKSDVRAHWWWLEAVPWQLERTGGGG